MNERIELKFRLEKSEISSLFRWMKQSNGHQLFPQRTISSLYFDTNEKLFYLRTREGLVPRSKVRVRCYGGHSAECEASHSLEIKTTRENSRDKISIPNWKLPGLLESGIQVEGFPPLFPTVRVNYLRDYFEIHGFRLTIDSEISYRNPDMFYSSETIVYDREIALEVKAPAGSSLDDLSNLFPFPRRQFSKYERGIEALSP